MARDFADNDGLPYAGNRFGMTGEEALDYIGINGKSLRSIYEGTDDSDRTDGPPDPPDPEDLEDSAP